MKGRRPRLKGRTKKLMNSIGAIQAYVFALLTSLYINDAVNLH